MRSPSSTSSRPAGESSGRRECLPADLAAQPQSGRHTLLKQLRLHALQPGGALIDQRLAQTHQRAQLKDLRWRDRRLLAAEQQPQLQIAVGVVGLRAPLAAPPGRRLRPIGQMRPIAGALDLLNNEAPAGRARERELDFMTGELRQPRTHINPRCRGDPTAPHLTRLTVQQLVRDLASMHTQTRLRSPSRPPRAPSETTPRDYHARAEEVSLHVISL